MVDFPVLFIMLGVYPHHLWPNHVQHLYIYKSSYSYRLDFKLTQSVTYLLKEEEFLGCFN